MTELKEILDSVYTIDNFMLALKLSLSLILLTLYLRLVFGFIKYIFCSVAEWFDDLKESRNKKKKVNLDKSKKI